MTVFVNPVDLPPEYQYDELQRRYISLVLDCPHSRGPAVVCTTHKIVERDAALLMFIRSDLVPACCTECRLDPLWLERLDLLLARLEGPRHD